MLLTCIMRMLLQYAKMQWLIAKVYKIGTWRNNKTTLKSIEDWNLSGSLKKKQ